MTPHFIYSADEANEQSSLVRYTQINLKLPELGSKSLKRTIFRQKISILPKLCIN